LPVAGRAQQTAIFSIAMDESRVGRARGLRRASDDGDGSDPPKPATDALLQVFGRRVSCRALRVAPAEERRRRAVERDAPVTRPY
jgi:hypothetical protein